MDPLGLATRDGPLSHRAQGTVSEKGFNLETPKKPESQALKPKPKPNPEPMPEAQSISPEPQSPKAFDPPTPNCSIPRNLKQPSTFPPLNRVFTSLLSTAELGIVSSSL